MNDQNAEKIIRELRTIKHVLLAMFTTSIAFAFSFQFGIALSVLSLFWLAAGALMAREDRKVAEKYPPKATEAEESHT